jgi:hypothetical protein
MTDLDTLTEERLAIVTELAAGNGGPLASHLETGGALYDDQRLVLIKYLRKELDLKRGNRRTFAQERREGSIVLQLRALQRRSAALHGSWGSYRRALDDHLKLDPSVGIETLKKYAKAGLVSREELDLIDRIRTEFIAAME